MSSPWIRVRRLRAAEPRDQAAVDRRALGRGAGVVRAGPVIWSGATSRTTVSSAGSKTTIASRCSAARRTTRTATRSISQGRQLSCEHLTRRVVRYEHDGSITVIAEAYDGKRLNSPNDVVAHPDGSYWFTDPPYGRSLYEGRPEKRELPNGVYRVDGKARRHAGRSPEEQVPDPNGLAFSPDYKKLYVVEHRKGPGRHRPRRQGQHVRVRVGADNRLSNGQRVLRCMIDGVKCAPDGVRCDVDGNVWCSSNAGRAVGYSGVTVWTPQGKLIGRIRLPEVCGNLCFGGPKRNRLFMAASQSIYAVYVNTQGAGPG